MKKSLALLIIFSLLLMTACGGMTDTITNSDPSAAEASGDAASQEDPEETEVSEEPVSLPDMSGTDIKIAVLGDSIARGYGLEDPETMRYSALLGKSLESVFRSVEVTNLAVDGLTGEELASGLENGRFVLPEGVDYVVISIGGNNVLGGFFELMNSAILEKDSIQAMTDYFRYLFASSQSEKERLSYSVEQVNGVFKKTNELLESEKFLSLLSEAALKLGPELERAVNAIRASEPQAKIFVQTVYNPYKDVELSLIGIETSIDLDSRGDSAVQRLNGVITARADELGYTVIPVYGEFEAVTDTKLTNAGIDLSAVSATLNYGFDPHPNAEGHKVISRVCYDTITGTLS